MDEGSVYVYQMASVSGSKILDFNIPPYIGNTYAQHFKTLRKKGTDIPILIQFNEYPPYTGDEFIGRLQLVGHGAIELKNILPSDEGWYELSILNIDDTTNSPYDTWIYLSVHSEYRRRGYDVHV